MAGWLSDAVELVKLVGGIAGLATAAFTIWDGGIRSRPVVTIIPELDGRTVEHLADVFLLLRNSSDRAIVVESITTSQHPRVTVATHDTVEGAAAAAMGHSRIPFVREKTERLFPVVDQEQLDPDAAATRFWIRIYWRPQHAWLPRVPVLRRTSTREIRALVRDAHGRHQGARERAAAS